MRPGPVTRVLPLLFLAPSLAALVTCGRANLYPAAVEPASSGAGAGGAAGAAGVAAASGAPGGGGSTASGGAGGGVAAVCASPAGCNDSPTMSAIAGTCHVASPATSEAPAAWYCACADGFSVNPKTGLCRAGTACEAAAADPWTVTGDLPTSDCSARLAQSCIEPLNGADDCSPSPTQVCPRPLDEAMLLFLQRMCHLPAFHKVRLELVGGCVSRYQLTNVTGGAIAPGLESCLQVFLKYRFDCAATKDCTLAEWDTLL